MKLQRKNITRKIIIFIFIILLINIIFFAIPTYILKKKKVDIAETEKVNAYNLIDLIKYSIEENLIKINNDNNSEIIYENTYNICIDYNSNENLVYTAYIYLDNELCIEKKLESGSNEIEITSLSEGTHNIKIEIKNEESVIKTLEKQISYIEKYKKQFLDELNENGVSWHIGNLSTDDINKAIELQKNMGIKTIRIEIKSSEVMDSDGNINLEKYDEKMKIIEESNMNVIFILDTNMGTDRKVTNAEEMEKYKNYVTEIASRYPFLNCFEICNEPNWYYKTDEEIKLYVNVVKETRDMLPDKTILVGCTMQYDSDNWSEEDSYDYDRFLKKISDYGAYPESDVYTYHVYTLKPDNNQLINYVESQNELQNSIGGFQKLYITETGLPSIERIGERKQAETLIQQKNLLNEGEITGSITYNFRNTGTNIINYEHNYGILKIDYTPKLSYYALQNYYENTNGAEYIGTVDLAEGLEAHVYDKDGNPKIIAWYSDDAENTITIPYKNFVASDIYGNKIENIDGTLEISSSPIYLDDISDSYFYEAISNTALSKYSEFEEKYSAEIQAVPGLSGEINSLKAYISSLNGKDSESEDTAKQKMADHFNLGNMILDAYRNRDLNIEYVKISSMLDMLNDIGNSYEDLVTVSAVTREPYYNSTDELIDSAENVMEINSDLNIVYPSKILDFAKELDEKSEYINSLTEENDIKTGLIVSNSLHAYYLADWANEFAKIYRDEYIEANPVTISYSNTSEWTNEDVVATLNIGKDSKVTNNNGNNTYIFNKNGTFTFEYERRGQVYKLEAKATNIDKEAPTIKGVEDGKIYINSAKPIIEDENISSIFIRFNDTTIAYYEGIILQYEGTYNITAMDKAGNTSVMEFYVVDENPDGYIINNNYIQNVWQKTTVKEFKEEFRLNANYTIKRSGSELHENDYVATGDTIELSAGISYTIVVAGDINNDGKVTVYDLSKLRRYILKQEEFNEIQLLAADINVDNQDIGVKDYSRMRIEILGRY